MALKQTLTAVALAATMMTGAASAATLSIDGGTAGTIGAGNDALEPLGLTNPLAGYFSSVISLVGAGKVTFTALGSEAGFKNTFTTGPFSANNNANHNGFTSEGFASFVRDLMGGAFDFRFTTNGNGGGGVDNGDDNNPGGVDFFASILGNAEGTSGRSLYLFLDDGGAGPDGDYDDLVVRVDVAPVPIPAAGFMLVAGLGGLAALKRRRKAA